MEKPKPPQYTIDIDAGTLLLIVSALILVPLLLDGLYFAITLALTKKKADLT